VEDIRALSIQGIDPTEKYGWVSWTRVAHQLSRASREVSLFGRAKYAGDANARARFEQWLVSVYQEEGLCRAVIGEIMDHGKCPVCHGVAWTIIKEKKVVCRSCKGTGQMVWTEKKLKGVAGKWDKEKYIRIRTRVLDIETELFRVMRRR